MFRSIEKKDLEKEYKVARLSTMCAASPSELRECMTESARPANPISVTNERSGIELMSMPLNKRGVINHPSPDVNSVQTTEATYFSMGFCDSPVDDEVV